MPKTEVTKNPLDPNVLLELRGVIEASQLGGRIQRGVSWPEALDEAVNRYLSAVPNLTRSGLVQRAVAKYLGIAVPAPKAPAAFGSRAEYLPLEEAEVPA